MALSPALRHRQSCDAVAGGHLRERRVVEHHQELLVLELASTKLPHVLLGGTECCSWFRTLFVDLSLPRQLQPVGRWSAVALRAGERLGCT